MQPGSARAVNGQVCNYGRGGSGRAFKSKGDAAQQAWRSLFPMLWRHFAALTWSFALKTLVCRMCMCAAPEHLQAAEVASRQYGDPERSAAIGCAKSAKTSASRR
jgi:hypothetical protein